MHLWSEHIHLYIYMGKGGYGSVRDGPKVGSNQRELARLSISISMEGSPAVFSLSNLEASPLPTSQVSLPA